MWASRGWAVPDRSIFNVPYPPSTISGDLYRYLTMVAQYLNTIPAISLTSYSGGPNSHLTGAPGNLAINVVSSAQTARVFLKEVGSGNTGWVSFATVG